MLLESEKYPIDKEEKRLNRLKYFEEKRKRQKEENLCIVCFKPKHKGFCD